MIGFMLMGGVHRRWRGSVEIGSGMDEELDGLRTVLLEGVCLFGCEKIPFGSDLRYALKARYFTDRSLERRVWFVIKTRGRKSMCDGLS